MASSPAHRFGQIIGDLLEEIMLPLLQDFCDNRRLYLDKKGIRSARKGKKVTWLDKYENAHDLDFVIERGGSDSVVGRPVAFIEAAWRRYTKHSKNQVQEIQGVRLQYLRGILSTCYRPTRRVVLGFVQAVFCRFPILASALLPFLRGNSALAPLGSFPLLTSRPYRVSRYTAS